MKWVSGSSLAQRLTLHSTGACNSPRLMCSSVIFGRTINSVVAIEVLRPGQAICAPEGTTYARGVPPTVLLWEIATVVAFPARLSVCPLLVGVDPTRPSPEPDLS
jgi:hypothetical protein